MEDDRLKNWVAEGVTSEIIDFNAYIFEFIGRQFLKVLQKNN